MVAFRGCPPIVVRHFIFAGIDPAAKLACLSRVFIGVGLQFGHYCGSILCVPASYEQLVAWSQVRAGNPAGHNWEGDCWLFVLSHTGFSGVG